MPVIELSAGPVQYVDSGGDGAVLVLTHGLLMDASVWQEVIADLSRDHRCIAPTFPVGSHRHPMREGADFSPAGLASLLAEFLEAVDLRRHAGRQ